MDYKVLYRKYRPDNFDSLVGQEYTTKTLKNIIKEGKISHAYIFTGPRGTGKTSSAKIFAKAINCPNTTDGNPCNNCDFCKKANENPDIIEIDAASNNSVDDIRELIENSKLVPSISKYKVYIIDEFHMLSTSAFNALLLTLEEPPSNVVFILATTDIQSVPITVLSRCQRFDFKPINNEVIVGRLKEVSEKEKINITDDALKEISYMSNGGLRDALSILDQISTIDGKIDAEDVIKNFGSISSKKIENLIEIFEHNDVKKMIDLLNQFKVDGIDYRILTEKIIYKFKNILIDLKMFKSNYSFKFDDIYNLILELSNSLGNVRNSIDPYVFIEIIIIKYMNVSRETLDDKTEKTTENKIENDSITDEQVKDNEEQMNKENYEKTNTCSFNVNTRINNCFANAKKEFLNKIKDKWNDFLIYESDANKAIMSFILDTEIVAASDKYAILTNKIESTAELINNNISSIEKDFSIFYNMKYKFVCLSEKNWKNEQKNYIFNVKNNIKYSIIEEAEENSNPIVNENSDELEKIAAEIFDSNIEIK